MEMEIEDTASFVNTNDFFGCMLGGDMKIKGVGKRNIILMGKSMIGKSTLFNYIIGQQLVAKKNGIMDVVYEKKNKTKNSRIGKNPSTSETLLPNIHPNLEYSQIYNSHKTKSDITLLDMAGFDDRNRSYRGVFTVSYMLKSVFEKTQQFKIILVTNGLTLQQSTVEAWKKPFMDLIQILNIQKTQDFSSFYRCVALVVTKAKIEGSKEGKETKQAKKDLLRSYYEKFNKLLMCFEQQRQNDGSLDRKDQMLYDLVKSIKDDKRIEIFEQAVIQKDPEQCKIIENLSKNIKRWSFYTFKNGQNADQIFYWPFNQQKNGLKEKHLIKYKQDQNQKNQSLQGSYKILTDFVEQVNKKWAWPSLQKPQDCLIRISQVLKKNHYFKHQTELGKKRQIIQNQLRQLIQTRAPKSQQGSLLQWMKIRTKNGCEKFPKKGLQLLHILEQIAKIVGNIEKIEEQHREAQQQGSSSIEKLEISILKVFLKFKEIICGTKKQEQNFLEFIFVNIRALRQSSIINKIDENQGSLIQIMITDFLKKLLGSGIEDIKEKFMKNFPPQTENQVNQLSNELQMYLVSIGHLQQKAGLIRDIRIRKINMVEKQGKIQFDKGEYQKAILKYLEAMGYLQNLQSQWRLNNDYNPKIIENLIKGLYLRISESLRKKIQKKGEKEETIRFIHSTIVKIYKAIRATERLQQHLNDMINRGKLNGRQRDYMGELAQFQASYGRKDDALRTYQKILDYFFQKQNSDIEQKMLSLEDVNPNINLKNEYGRAITIDTALNDQIKEKLRQLEQSQ